MPTPANRRASLDYRDYSALVLASAGGHDRLVDAIESHRDLDPDAMLYFANSQHLGPWLAWCLDGPRASDCLPSRVLDALETTRVENVARCERIAGLSRELRAGLEADGLGPLFLKGLTHGARLYGDPSRRYQADIDLLLPRIDIRRAIEVLGKLGYDTSRDASTGQPLAERVEAMLAPGLGSKVRNSCTIIRDVRERVDLHWCIRTHYERAVPAARLWRGARMLDVGGLELPALGEENMLLVLLLNIAADLRKSRCRAKLFLELYQLCRSIDLPGGWGGFLDRRHDEGSERLVVNVLALFLSMWRCGAELPELRAELLGRARQIETSDADEALEIIMRPRDHEANRLWHARVHPQSDAEAIYARMLRSPLRYAMRRLRPRRGASLLAAG